jgi:RNase H-fold protein (predicted Holliday junction resolvase)
MLAAAGRVAVSDVLGQTAQPVMTLVRSNRRQDARSLLRVIRKHSCTEIVVGNPLYMSGGLNQAAAVLILQGYLDALAVREERSAQNS